MKKQLPALIAALLMTGFVTFVMVVTGVNALMNKNIEQTTASSSSTNAGTVSPAQVRELQNRINEYAQRELEYQKREKQYQQELQSNMLVQQQATQQTRQVKELLMALQSRGLIQIQENGNIMITGKPGN
jgi:hypothetical protein